MAQLDDQKLWAIVRITQGLNQSHLFTDGNIRITAMVLMNSLLIKEGFPPVIWEDPNVLDGHSLDECCAHVKQG